MFNSESKCNFEFVINHAFKIYEYIHFLKITE